MIVYYKRMANAIMLLGAVLGTDCVLYAETLAWIAGAVITTIGAVYYARRLKTPVE